MSFDKAIEHKKEKRKPYYDTKAIDNTCRNHGSCRWCKANRFYKDNKMNEKFNQMIKEELYD